MTNPDNDPRLNDPTQPGRRPESTGDRTTVVTSGSGNAGLLIAAVVVALLLIAFFTFGGFDRGSDVTVAPEGTSQETTGTVQQPAEPPAAPAETAPAAPTEQAPADTAPEAPATEEPPQPTQPAQ